jgi:lipid biosynthesis B12-binding/radical SAM protein
LRRVLLLSSNVSREPFPVYPLGLAVIDGALTAGGYLTETFDFLVEGESEERLAEAIRAFAPDFVCVSLRNLDNCDSIASASYPGIARTIVRAVRASTAAPVILGGPAFSILPEELLAYTGADHGVVGEGEEALVALLCDLSAGRRPPAVLRGGRALPGAEMASPRFDRRLAAFYLEGSGMLNLQTKRGCPHGCIYCSYPTLEGKAFRTRDPGAVADDLERARTDLGAETFFFTDSVFNDAAGHYLLVAEEIARRALGVRWCCYLRPAGIGREEISLLKRAGMHAAELGTDGASDAMLDSLGKGFSFSDVEAANRAFAAERIPCAHFVMFGAPGETAGTVAEGLKNLDRLEHCVVFAYSGIRILPGTRLHAIAVAEGAIRADLPMRDPVYYHSPGLDAEGANRAVEESFRGRRDRIFPPSEGQKRMAVMHGFGYRGLLWDTLIRYPKEEPC